MLNPEFCCVGVFCTLEDSSCTDFTGGAAGRNDQLDIVIAVIEDLGDAVMQEADTDYALADADIFARAGAGLGVNFNVLIQIAEVLDAFIMAELLDHGVDNKLCRAGSLVVGQPDQPFILRLQQICKVLRSLKSETIQLFWCKYRTRARQDFCMHPL